MGALQDKIILLKTFTPEKVEQGILKIIQDHEEVITQMNTDQLYEGLRADGKDMPNYSPASVTFYGKLDGPIRLYDQGDFYRGFFVDASKFPVEISSNDRKTPMLSEGYDEIFGVTKENQENLNKGYLLDPIREFFRSIL